MVNKRKIRKTRTKKRRIQKGGHIQTFVGKALNYSNLNTWPGVTNHGGNHYAFNDYPVDLQTGNIKNNADSFFKGGYTYKNNRGSSSIRRRTSRRSSRRRKYKGGNLPLLGDLRMASQVVQNNIADTQLTFQGKPGLVSPLPWKDQYATI
jgi:hypothetical protein